MAGTMDALPVGTTTAADLAPAALLDASAPKLGWEDCINFHSFEMILSTATGDFSYFTSLRLQNASNQVDRAAILSAAAPELSQEVRQALGKINIDAAKS
jgi:hypothetical protein